ncbi:MAG: replication initiator protein [Microvirus sp.]|nr:MAG: replication initiator protein [Microvirus sp.]
MACYHPITAWRSQVLNPSGKRSLIFKAAGGHGLPILINCGQCVGCKIERARQLAIRCVHESDQYEEKIFATLTYSDAALPAGRSLRARHLQLFLKRLRRFFKARRLRFFACGEYGDTTDRPHYHAILWNVNFHDRIRYDNELFTSKTLDAIWSHGECKFGTVTYESAAYIARYSLKKIRGDLAKEHYTRLDYDTGEIYEIEPEFIRMSQGLGRDWFIKNKSDLYPDDFVVQKGKKLRVPKYYDSKLPEHELAPIKEQRKVAALRYRSNNTAARLAVRKEVQIAKLKQLKRKYE